MTVRITTSHQPDRTIIKIDGRLNSPDLDELTGMLQGLSGAMSLDLTDLQSVDRAGTGVLKQLLKSGVQLQGVSPYVDLMLKSETPKQG